MFRFFIEFPFSVETPPFMVVEFEPIGEVRNPLPIRATHKAALYVSPYVLKPCLE